MLLEKQHVFLQNTCFQSTTIFAHYNQNHKYTNMFHHH